MKKFLGKLFIFALYAFVIGAIAKARYDMFGDTEKLKKEAELVARFENYVPEEVVKTLPVDKELKLLVSYSFDYM